jgi:hypothetical protein
MTTVSIMQPAYLPWLGFFDRIVKSDVVVILDHVTIDKNTKTQFTNRNRVWGANGPVWLTVPVMTGGKKDTTPIHDIAVAPNIKWQSKHVRTLQASYAKAPFFADYAPLLIELISAARPLLVDYINPVTDLLLSQLGLERQIVFASEMDLRARKDELVVEICKKLAATTYISGPFGRDYLDRTAFAASGIGLRFHDYPHPEYPQRKPPFQPYLSVIDLLFNCGPEALDTLTSPNTALAAS